MNNGEGIRSIWCRNEAKSWSCSLKLSFQCTKKHGSGIIFDTIFNSLSSSIFEIFDLQKVDCWKKLIKIAIAFLRSRSLNFEIAIVLRSFDLIAIADLDLDREKKIAIDNQKIADHSCLVDLFYDKNKKKKTLLCASSQYFLPCSGSTIKIQSRNLLMILLSWKFDIL